MSCSELSVGAVGYVMVRRWLLLGSVPEMRVLVRLLPREHICAPLVLVSGTTAEVRVTQGGRGLGDAASLANTTTHPSRACVTQVHKCPGQPTSSCLASFLLNTDWDKSELLHCCKVVVSAPSSPLVPAGTGQAQERRAEKKLLGSQRPLQGSTSAPACARMSEAP